MFRGTDDRTDRPNTELIPIRLESVQPTARRCDIFDDMLRRFMCKAYSREVEFEKPRGIKEGEEMGDKGVRKVEVRR